MKATRHRVTHITVGHFYTNHGKALGLYLEGPSAGLNRKIREPTINRPGLALSGFYSYFAGKRIQVFGSAELSYLRSLKPATEQTRLRELLSRNIPCLVIARNATIPPTLLRLAAEKEIPVFRTPMITMKFMNAATIALELDFAPSTQEYGSMVDIQGIGTLIRGDSGIGKSECVLSLIERGYSLISDDITKVRSVEGRELIGTSPELTRFHMEARGLGVIDISAMFGIGSVRVEKQINFVVTLKDWEELEHIDRIGLDGDTYKILGIMVPHVTIPVRKGRDMSRLVEVAALDQKLKSMGKNSAEEFNQRLLLKMNDRRSR